MKLLFDENPSPKLVSLLRDVYPEASHIHFAGMDHAADTEIWEFARTGGWSIVTKDSDFHQRSMVVGHPPKVVWLRVGNCSLQAIAELLRTRYIIIQRFHDDPRRVPGVVARLTSIRIGSFGLRWSSRFPAEPRGHHRAGGSSGRRTRMGG